MRNFKLYLNFILIKMNSFIPVNSNANVPKPYAGKKSYAIITNEVRNAFIERVSTKKVTIKQVQIKIWNFMNFFFHL